jgi:predicted nuclease of predicted toxin-antitoxin system
MKILLDSCVWGKAKIQLSHEGYDVEWAGDWPKDPGDLEILARAHSERRVLVTLDKDFGELAIVRNISHSGIIRLVGISARKQAELCSYIFGRYRDAIEKGAIITVEANRVRIRLSQ